MARRGTNYPDHPLLDELTDAQRNAVIDGANALAEHDQFKRTSFERWMTIARGVAPLCDLADRPGTSRKARKNFLKENGYGSLNESTVSRLRWMAKLETAIRIWRDEPRNKRHRDAWNSPTSITNRCPAVRKAMAEAAKDKPPRKPRQSNRVAAVENALDVLADYLHSLEDADAKAALVERIVAITRPHSGAPQQAAPAPKAKKPKRRGRLPRKGEVLSNIGGLDVVIGADE